MKDLLKQEKVEGGEKKDKYEGKERVFLYMKILFGLFLIWLGYNIMYSQQRNEIYIKYMKKSFTAGRKYIDELFPGLLANKYIINLFDFDILVMKAKEITNGLSYSLMISGILIAIGFKLGKTIAFLTILLDLILVHNLIYFREEKIKVNVLKVLAILGGAYYL